MNLGKPILTQMAGSYYLIQSVQHHASEDNIDGDL